MRSQRHWSIYLPALFIAILWSAILIWADTQEPRLETLRALALLVEAVAVPLLYLRAFFRGRGSEVLIHSQSLYVSTGGFSPERLGADLVYVETLEVSRSLLQRLVGSGRIQITLQGGRCFTLDDMSEPEALRTAFQNAKGLSV
ncbi:MAG: PH domain-containing protein [Parvibaculum sp.]